MTKSHYLKQKETNLPGGSSFRMASNGTIKHLKEDDKVSEVLLEWLQKEQSSILKKMQRTLVVLKEWPKEKESLIRR